MASSHRTKLINVFGNDGVPFTLTKHKNWNSDAVSHGVTVMYIPEIDLSFEFTASGRVLNVTDGNAGE